MSRKDLSRTVIEGGRYFANHSARDHSHRMERARTRTWLDRVSIDHEAADGTSPRERPPVPKQFRDKLGPTKRWLQSHVGRPWDAVYSELCRTFDRRSLAGMHVVDVHIVGEVRQHPWIPAEGRHRVGYDFVVDEHGILRRSRVQWHELRRQQRKLNGWLAGRRASLTHRGWWWLRLTMFDLRTVFVWDRPLTTGDLRRIARLPDELRYLATIASPFASARSGSR